MFVDFFRLGDNITSLKDVRITAEEEVLANNLKAPDLSPLEPMRSGNQSLVPAPTDHLVPVCDQNSQSESEGGFGQRSTDKKPAEQMERFVFLWFKGRKNRHFPPSICQKVSDDTAQEMSFSYIHNQKRHFCRAAAVFLTPSCGNSGRCWTECETTS